MDECLNAIVGAINAKRESAEFYRTYDSYKDGETGKPQAWAQRQAFDCDEIANEMERIMHTLFNV